MHVLAREIAACARRMLGSLLAALAALLGCQWATCCMPLMTALACGKRCALQKPCSSADRKYI